MNFKQEKGAIGIDIAIAIVVIFLFVTVIATLSYQYQSINKEIALKSQALEIAISEIERIKNEGFENYQEANNALGPIIENKDLGTEDKENEGFYETVIVKDYAELHPEEAKIENLVKKVTVIISYMFKGETKSVELNTILSKD